LAARLRSVGLSIIRAVQRTVGWAFLLVIFGFLCLFVLQFPRFVRLDAWRGFVYLHFWGDPVVREIGSWVGVAWPAQGWSFLPLVVAFATWVGKVSLDAAFNWLYRTVATPKKRAADEEAALIDTALGRVPADSEHAREELLKRYREIEDALKASKRKSCAFLSVDVVGSTQMKQGEEDTAIAATFQAYEEMLKQVFEQHGAWKAAWTPDGVMVCFLQLDLAVGAGQRVLQSLRRFNEVHNKLRTSFRVRAGVNYGEVSIYEDSKLEKIADHVIDVAGHMQKEGRPNSLWLGGEIYNLLADKSGFRLVGQLVDGMPVYEWSLEPPRGGTMAARAPRRAELVATSDRGSAAGTRRVGRYEILQELGRGAMGAVYKARDPQIARTVAIKVILVGNQSPEVLEDYLQRFYREAQTAGQMSHPGIVTIHDVGEDEDGQPYLVMEYVEGTTLDKLLVPSKPGEPCPPRDLRQILTIAIQVADALDYAHRRNVIHRDIKPANILITSEGRAKIADFGIAKLAGTHMTHTGLIVGTPAFMSPEQITGGVVDSRSDIFSFGILLYWMCAGSRPFAGESITEVAYRVVHTPPTPLREFNADVPLELETLLSRCLAKKPEERYQTARELTNDLEALRAKQPVAPVSLPAASSPSS
jgi:class 3 adenylate cyclase